MATRAATTAHTVVIRMLVWLAVVLAIAGWDPAPARADSIYVFRTLSATIDGAPSNQLDAFGQISVSDSAVAGGHASVTTPDPQLGPSTETLDGITSVAFGFNFGPVIWSPQGVINFTADLSGQNLHITPVNSDGGFIVNETDNDAYFAIGSANSDILTIGYGTDNLGSPCAGPQEPNVSHCVVTGEFVYAGGAPPLDPVPEPAALPTLFGSLSLFAGALIWRRRCVPVAG
jgi:hypothetical protein